MARGLLELERLLHLLKLLADYPDLATTDRGSREAFETLVSPLPSGDLAERAAALLRTLQGVCYGDGEAVRRDLAWLEAQGFFSATPVTRAISPLPPAIEPAGAAPRQGGVNGGLWHLAWEEDTIGRPHGLLQCERLERLERLLHHCGGTELGDDSASQEGLCQPSAEQRRRQLQTLRFSCKPGAYARIREGQLPLPLKQIRVERAATPSETQSAGNGTGQGWIHPDLSQVLPPNPPGDSHPHPVEIDLPPWILTRRVELQRWLFSHGSAIRIEAPEVLRQEQQGQALEVLALGQQRPAG